MWGEWGGIVREMNDFALEWKVCVCVCACVMQNLAEFFLTSWKAIGRKENVTMLPDDYVSYSAKENEIKI